MKKHSYLTMMLMTGALAGCVSDGYHGNSPYYGGSYRGPYYGSRPPVVVVDNDDRDNNYYKRRHDQEDDWREERREWREEKRENRYAHQLARGYNAVRRGMNGNDVSRLMGQPRSADRYRTRQGEVLQWHYRSEHNRYTVNFLNGRVSGKS